jgi:hypothetical protein
MLQNPKPRTLRNNHSMRGRSAATCHIMGVMMNKAESDHIHELCSLIAAEQDRQVQRRHR